MFPNLFKFLLKLKDLFSDEILSDYIIKENLTAGMNNDWPVNNQLNNNLKHLEFISFFETHIDSEQLGGYSLIFLLELNRVKYESQIHSMTLISLQVE